MGVLADGVKATGAPCSEKEGWRSTVLGATVRAFSLALLPGAAWIFLRRPRASHSRSARPRAAVAPDAQECLRSVEFDDSANFSILGFVL